MSRKFVNKNYDVESLPKKTLFTKNLINALKHAVHEINVVQKISKRSLFYVRSV
jgi:hypothetical protein